MPESWRGLISTMFRTPRRAAISVVVIVVILYFGIIKTLVGVFLNSVFMPLLLLAILIAILNLVLKGGRRR